MAQHQRVDHQHHSSPAPINTSCKHLSLLLVSGERGRPRQLVVANGSDYTSLHKHYSGLEGTLLNHIHKAHAHLKLLLHPRESVRFEFPMKFLDFRDLWNRGNASNTWSCSVAFKVPFQGVAM